MAHVLSKPQKKGTNILDLPQEVAMRFFTLHNEFENADTHDKRTKASWAFFCFVYKHLGEEMLTFFTEQYFKKEMAKSVALMVKTRAFLQPNLFEKD